MSNRSRAVRETQLGFPIVALGASAGGLAAFEAFFTGLGGVSGLKGAAFVLIQHLDPVHKSLLTELIQRRTELPVTEVTAPTALVPGHVYVITPGHDLTLTQGILDISVPVETRGRRLPIDHFLRSLALGAGKSAVGVILSGTGNEGASGIRNLKAAGGLVVVQDPSTAEY